MPDWCEARDDDDGAPGDGPADDQQPYQEPDGPPQDA